MAGETTTVLTVGNRDLPALFQTADHASLGAQRKYLLHVKIDLTALVLGALCASFTLSNPLATQILRWFGALLLAIGLGITVVLMLKGYRGDWFGGRAIAESAKTLAWRYMAGAEPFEKHLEPSEVDDRFVDSLRSIMQQHEKLMAVQAEISDNGRQITDTMETVRNASMEERKALYLKDRIEDQACWYSKKSAFNRRSEMKLFAQAIGAQALALFAAVLMAIYPTSDFNPTGILSALAAAVLAWLQAKQHQELAQSYGLAAAELGLIAEKSRHIKDDESLSAFVGDAEQAISREHTLWLARRDQIVHS